MSIPVTNERQLKNRNKPKISPRDRVGTQASNWYAETDPTLKLFPIVYGTVVNVTEFSANVYWDLDEKTASIALAKLDFLPPDTPLQCLPDKNPPPSIFKIKNSMKRKKSKKDIRLSEEQNVRDDGSHSADHSDSDNGPSTSKKIKIGSTARDRRLTKAQEKAAENRDTPKFKDHAPKKITNPDNNQLVTRGRNKMKRIVSSKSEEKSIPSKESTNNSKKPLPSKKPMSLKQKTTMRKSSSHKDKSSSSASSDTSDSELSDVSVNSETSDTDTLPTSMVQLTETKKTPKTAEEKKADRLKEEKDFGWVDGDKCFDARGPAATGYGPRLKNFNPTSTTWLWISLFIFSLLDISGK